MNCTERRFFWGTAIGFFLLTACFHECFSNAVYAPFREHFGHARTEYVTAITLCLLLSGMLISLRRYADFSARHESARWGICVTGMAAVALLLMVTNIELVHYVQYAVLTILLRRAGCSELTAYAAALACSVCDEGRQYMLHPRFTGYFDWNDLLLNNLGIVAGILAVRKMPEVCRHDRRIRLVAWVILLLPAVLALGGWLCGRVVAYAELPPGTAATAFPLVDGERVFAFALKRVGTEFWQTAERGRTFHILSVGEGLLLCPLCAGLFWLLVRRRRNNAITSVLPVILALCAVCAVEPVNAAPATGMRHIPVIRTMRPPHIDGNLEDECWQNAVWTSRFTDLADADAPVWLATSVALCWDGEALYVGARLEEPWLEAAIWEHDGTVYRDPDLEVFLAGQDAYWELEVNAAGTVYDVFWIWRDALAEGSRFPAALWNDASRRTVRLAGIGEHRHPRGERVGFVDADMKGLRTAVQRKGTLNNNTDADQGWTVEIAIPWKALGPLADNRPIYPMRGDIWKLNIFRFVNRANDGTRFSELRPAGWALASHGVFDAHMPECFADAVLIEAGQ